MGTVAGRGRFQRVTFRSPLLTREWPAESLGRWRQLRPQRQRSGLTETTRAVFVSCLVTAALGVFAAGRGTVDLAGGLQGRSAGPGCRRWCGPRRGTLPRGLDLVDFTREDFPLPTLGPILHSLVGELVDGRGFVLLQITPVVSLNERQCEILALGLGRHIGRTVPQREGKHMQHVRALGVEPSGPTSRSYQHSGQLGYHADPNELVALLCVRPAKSGGLSCIVSSVAVHNEIVRTRPDLAEVLYQPWWRDRRTGDGPDSFYQSPVYTTDTAGRLRTSYGPDYMHSALRGAHVPPFSPAQLDAMELLDRRLWPVHEGINSEPQPLRGLRSSPSRTMRYLLITQ
ncbi:TauD/TfdA family dioxygenase [Streptomyces sp. NPDC005784]|uniref:TauD/TfdA family dioxygenase n=1 Tax=Streptomyces sp. NPDC005784 TaxID=3364731 RepID=UPI0036A01DCE